MITFSAVVHWLVLCSSIYTTVAVHPYVTHQTSPSLEFLEVVGYPPFDISPNGNHSPFVLLVLDHIVEKLSPAELYKFGKATGFSDVQYEFNRIGTKILYNNFNSFTDLLIATASHESYDSRHFPSELLTDDAKLGFTHVHLYSQIAITAPDFYQEWKPRQAILRKFLSTGQAILENHKEIVKLVASLEGSHDREYFKWYEHCLSSAEPEECFKKEVSSNPTVPLVQYLADHYIQSQRLLNYIPVGDLSLTKAVIDLVKFPFGEEGGSLVNSVKARLDTIMRVETTWQGIDSKDPMYSVKWIPHSRLATPTHCFVFFPLLYVHRMAHPDFLFGMFRIYKLSPLIGEYRDNAMLMRSMKFKFLWDIPSIAILDTLQTKGEELARNFVRRFCAYFSLSFNFSPTTSCPAIFNVFIDYALVYRRGGDLSQVPIEEGNVVLKNIISLFGELYDYQVNPDTNERELYLAISEQQYAIRHSWANLLEEYYQKRNPTSDSMDVENTL